MNNKKKKLADKDMPDPGHVDWLVENRADTQRVSAKLYKLLRMYQPQLKDKKPGLDAQMLIAVSFSLWRSAFLSDKKGLLELSNEDAVWFLGEMLQHNAISYIQDRKAKHWTFNYYVSDALNRLEKYSKDHSKSDIGPLVPPKSIRDPKGRWEYLQDAFERAVEHFGGRLERAANNSK